MNIKTIAFCFPYYEVSGVPVLFSNLADYFSNNYTYKIFVVDYEKGYMSTILKENKKIENIIFEKGKTVIINTDILILQSILPYGMRPEINIAPTTRILFWNLHPDNLIPQVYPWALIGKRFNQVYKQLVILFWRKKYNLMTEFIANAVRKNSLVFMDSSNFNSTINFYPNINVNNVPYLPIACSNGGNLRKREINNDLTEINFSWIGRICDFKIHILNHLIIRLSEFSKNNEQKINLHIIGDGPEMENLNMLSCLQNYFKIILVGSLPKVQMDNYLYSKIDINASMGTSVLESAKFGIPSIVLDFDYKPIDKKYRFRWLHKTENYDVGHLITESDYSENDNLNKMINEYIVNRQGLSKNAFDYYLENHSLEKVSEKLKKQIEKTELTITDINPVLLKKGLIRRIYEKRKYGI